MKFALIGYGRMGHEIETVLIERGHEVVLTVDPTPGVASVGKLSANLLEGLDAAIEFSLPAAIVENARIYAEAGIAAIVGTTGWDAQKSLVESIVKGGKGAFLYGSNFSIGAHLMFALAAKAAQLIAPFADYDIMVHEFHHKNKVDSPSGTALSIAKAITQNLPRKSKIQTKTLDRAILPDELHVSSTRGGSFPGVHSVLVDSLADTIEITHTARSRKGFALGSVLAAEWLVGKSGFYRVEDFIADLTK